MHRDAITFMSAVLLAVFTSVIPATAQSPASPPAEGDAAAPRLQIANPTAHVGSHWLDHGFEFAFELQNTGSAPLEIVQIEPAADVTARLDPAGPIAPGAAATIKGGVNCKKMMPGAFEKSLTILTNDPLMPQASLRINGKCKHYVDVVPYAAGFGRLDGDAGRERLLTIRNQSDRPVQVTLDETSLDKSFSYQLFETEPGRVFQLYIDTRPPYPPGTFQREIRLNTTHPGQPVLTVGVYAIMPERLEITPRIISLNNASQSKDAPLTHVVGVNNNGVSPVRIVSGSCSDPRVTVEVREVREGRKYRALVKLPAGYTPPENGADILLKTNDNEIPVVTIPIGRANRPASVVRNSAPLRGATAGQSGTKTVQPPVKKPVLDMIGTAAPAYSLESIEGAPVTNRELEFHPATVLNFFAPNCPHCKRQLPKVEQLRQQFEPLGVRFVNVSEKMRKDFTPDETAAVLADLGANSELAIDTGNAVGRRFKATGYPCLFVIRKDGVIDHVVSGNKRDIDVVVTEKLNTLVEGETHGSEKSAKAPTP